MDELEALDTTPPATFEEAVDNLIKASVEYLVAYDTDSPHQNIGIRNLAYWTGVTAAWLEQTRRTVNE